MDSNVSSRLCHYPGNLQINIWNDLGGLYMRPEMNSSRDEMAFCLHGTRASAMTSVNVDDVWRLFDVICIHDLTNLSCSVTWKAMFRRYPYIAAKSKEFATSRVQSHSGMRSHPCPKDRDETHPGASFISGTYRACHVNRFVWLTVDRDKISSRDEFHPGMSFISGLM